MDDGMKGLFKDSEFKLDDISRILKNALFENCELNYTKQSLDFNGPAISAVLHALFPSEFIQILGKKRMEEEEKNEGKTDGSN
ncbi:MAG: hypothetical protein LKJ76_04785 [Lachnospiraceae bacterium]|jgi:hypothetical protein|nr:hypothetical protein [Lachnospiraceae bacterium]